MKGQRTVTRRHCGETVRNVRLFVSHHVLGENGVLGLAIRSSSFPVTPPERTDDASRSLAPAPPGGHRRARSGGIGHALSHRAAARPMERTDPAPPWVRA